jgi:hypothetical protein
LAVGIRLLELLSRSRARRHPQALLWDGHVLDHKLWRSRGSFGRANRNPPIAIVAGSGIRRHTGVRAWFTPARTPSEASDLKRRTLPAHV